VKFSFRTKVPLTIISLLVLFGAGLALSISHIASRALVEEHKKRGISSAINLAARAVEPLLAMDLLQLKNLSEGVVRTDQDISYAFLLDKDGEPLVYNFSGGFPIGLKGVNKTEAGEEYHIRLVALDQELIYDIAVPVLIGTDRLGTVRLGISRGHVQSVVNWLLGVIFLSTGLGVLVAGMAGAALSRPVTRKIQRLHQAAEEIIKGNLDLQVAASPRQQCWEIKGCDSAACPAFGDREHRCWYVAGTRCPNCVPGYYKEKIAACAHCVVYQRQSGDELQHLAEFFDIMVYTLRERLEALQQSQADLQQQQQLFQTILDVTPDIVSLQDRRLRYQAVNKAFCRFVALEESEILGCSGARVFPEDQSRQHRQEDLRVIATGETIRVEREIAGPTGGRWFHLVKTPVTNPEGGIIGLLSTGRDITEMKLLHERLMRTQKLESLGQLAAGVAHEINTPLGIILGNAQLCLEDVPADGEMAENLQAVEKYSRVCRNIVADLLRFSRQTASERKLLNVNEVLAQVIGLMEHIFNLDNITVECDFDPGLPPLVGDQEKLEQVFINLLNNAYDAIGNRGTVSVSTGLDAEAREVVITFADTGPGIAGEIADKIYDPFFTTKGVGEGTGLGLSVTFGIIKDHGGKIDFQSPWIFPGGPEGANGGAPHGTRFTLRLPVSLTLGPEEGDNHGQNFSPG